MADSKDTKPYLLRYLKLHGISAQPGEMINYFSPDHKDTDNSCMVDDFNFICYKCGKMGNIFDAINILEGMKPSEKATKIRAVLNTLTGNENA